MSAVEQVYHKLVDALPEDGVNTTDVVMALGALLSAIIIDKAKSPECRARAAKEICNKIMQAAETVPSIEEMRQTRH